MIFIPAMDNSSDKLKRHIVHTNHFYGPELHFYFENTEWDSSGPWFMSELVDPILKKLLPSKRAFAWRTINPKLGVVHFLKG